MLDATTGTKKHKMEGGGKRRRTSSGSSDDGRSGKRRGEGEARASKGVKNSSLLSFGDDGEEGEGEGEEEEEEGDGGGHGGGGGGGLGCVIIS